MAENNDNVAKYNLLGTVLDVVQGKQGQNPNELISLLALSNLLGIITFLNSQEFSFEGNSSKTSLADLTQLATNLLGGPGDDSSRKINPAILVNLLKNFTQEKTSESEKQTDLNKLEP